MSNTSRYPNLLVPDIWLQIAKVLRKCDINSFCRTSHYFLDLLRPTLYREAFLMPIETRPKTLDKYTAALDLLASDPELAQFVQVFHVHGPIFKGSCEMGLIPDYYLRVIRNMSSLRSLAITGSIVRDVDEQKQLVDILSRLDPPLTEFYHEEKDYTWAMPSKDFALPFLIKLNWRVSPLCRGYGEIHPQSSSPDC
jgi:hypothetical protein